MAAVLSGPKRGSVEYHKKGYLDLDCIAVPGKWLRYAPVFVKDRYFWKNAKRKTFHLVALVESGYLVRREIVITNGLPRYVELMVSRPWNHVRSNASDLVWIGRPIGSNAVVITAPAAMINEVEEWVRKADVPESGK